MVSDAAEDENPQNGSAFSSFPKTKPESAHKRANI
jgi:hypothetical protein